MTSSIQIDPDCNRGRWYHFVSQWNVEGTLEEVSNVFTDFESLRGWWPLAFRNVVVVRAGDRNREGATIDVELAGWLPFRLHNRFQLLEVEPARRCLVSCTGDLQGECECRGQQHGNIAVFDIEWRVRPHRRLLRWFTRFAEPLALSNHLWIMRTGERRLRAEVARRRGEIPAPEGSAIRDAFAAVNDAFRRRDTFRGLV